MSEHSESADEETPGLPGRALRTVTPPYVGRPDREMNVIGWSYFLGLLVLLLPLLPFIVIVWLISKVFEALRSD